MLRIGRSLSVISTLWLITPALQAYGVHREPLPPVDHDLARIQPLEESDHALEKEVSSPVAAEAEKKEAPVEPVAARVIEPAPAPAPAEAPPLAVESVLITSASPTRSLTLTLSYGPTLGDYDSYCILENETDSAKCAWVTGSLPSTYLAAPGGDRTLALSILVRDQTSGRRSAAVTSNAVALDLTPPELASVNVSESGLAGAPLNLSFGAVTGKYASYCILESALPSAEHCIWRTASLPAQYLPQSGAPGPLAIYLKDEAGNVSDPVFADPVRLKGALTVHSALETEE